MLLPLHPPLSYALSMLLPSLAASSPLHQKRDCTGQHIFHSPNPGEAAANKQHWVYMGLSATDLAIIMKEDAGRPTVQADENGAPGAWAFTIFNYNWWMVKQSCAEYTPAGYTTSSNEAQIPGETFDILNNNQTAATICLHQSMTDPFYNHPSDAPTSADDPSPAWWATQRGGPSAGMAYLAGDAMGSVERDYMWNTLGIRDWIVRGGHMTDDWIMASCLSGLSAPAPCPGEFPGCGAGYL